ncbi:MAG: CHASE3 domain-containing protein [Chitinophagaceae bacterium]|nr:CHASE3 domain-containing protein [Chitinophagaceae bacterium]
MKFNTALGFLLLANAVWIIESDSHSKWYFLARWIAWFMVVFGLLTAFQTLFGFDAGIDELLWKDDPNPVATVYPGRPSVQTSFSFAAFGVILLFLPYRKATWYILTLLVAILSLATLVFLNQLFGSSFLRAISWLDETALLTAVLFMFLSIALIKSRHLVAFQLNFEQKIGVYFGVSLLLLLFIFMAIADNNKQRADSDIAIRHTYDTQLMSERISKLTAEMQSNLRGFLVTKEDFYIDAYNNYATAIIREIKQFKKITDINEKQQQRVDSLTQLIERFIASRKILIAVFIAGELTPERLKVAANEGLFLGKSIHDIISTIQQEENALLEIREDRNNKTITNSNRIIAIFQILTLVLIISTFFIIRRKIAERNTAEFQLKQSEGELRKSMENFAFALESAGIGSWTINLISGEIKRSILHDQIMGYDEPVADWSFDVFFEKHVLPDDRQKVQQAWDVASGGSENLMFDCRINRPDGTIGWIWCKSRIFYNEEGKPSFLMGFVGDETAAKRAEQEIRMLNATLEKRVEEKTREVLEKETHYRSLLENMQEGIQIISPDFRHLFINKAAVIQSRYSEAELLGYTLMEKYPGIEKTEMFRQLTFCMQQRTSTVMLNEFQYPDGSKGWFELSIQPVPEGVLILSTDVSDQKRLEKELVEQQILQQKIITQLTIDAQEKERNELARELHDNINQILATAKIYLARAKKQEVIPQHLVQQGFECVNMAVDEIRTLSHTLVTPSLGDTGLIDALQGLSRQFANAHGQEITLINHLDPTVTLDEQKELMLYRIAQEQISNINKHAQASNVIITLASTAAQLEMTIADNGVGFDTTTKAKGIGLRNMQNRVQFYSGEMHIISAPGEGCRLEISVPL